MGKIPLTQQREFEVLGPHFHTNLTDSVWGKSMPAGVGWDLHGEERADGGLGPVESRDEQQ